MDAFDKTMQDIKELAGKKPAATPVRFEEHHHPALNAKVVGIPVYRKPTIYKGKTYGKA